MADNNSPARRKQEGERRIQAEDEGRQEKERREQLQERSRLTPFVEFLRHSHDLLSRPLRVKDPISLDYRGNTPSHGKLLPDTVGTLDTAQHNS